MKDYSQAADLEQPVIRAKITSYTRAKLCGGAVVLENYE